MPRKTRPRSPEIGDWLRRRREFLGLTQEQIVAALGLLNEQSSGKSRHKAGSERTILGSTGPARRHHQVRARATPRITLALTKRVTPPLYKGGFLLSCCVKEMTTMQTRITAWIVGVLVALALVLGSLNTSPSISYAADPTPTPAQSQGGEPGGHGGGG